MAEPHTGSEGPPGIIDTIGLAFALLNRRPYLIWIPVLVDLVVWAGLRMPLTGRVEIDSVPGGTEGSLIVERLSNIDFVSSVTWPIPNLLGQGPFADAPSPVSLQSVEIGETAGVLLAFVAFAVSIVLLAGWVAMIARLVDGSPASDLSWIWASPMAAFRLFLVVGAVIAVIGFLAIPFMFAAGGLHLMSVNPLGLLSLSLLLLTGWLGLFFLFSLPAIVVSNASVTGALRASYQLVLNHFLAVVALLAIATLVRVATPHALSVFAESQWSVPFAVIVNAYIVTGLLAAILLFYQKRSSYTQSSSAVSPAATG